MDLDEGDRLEKAATPGPWSFDDINGDYIHGDPRTDMDYVRMYNRNNADFLLWIRNNATELLAAARERDRLVRIAEEAEMACSSISGLADAADMTDPCEDLVVMLREWRQVTSPSR